MPYKIKIDWVKESTKKAFLDENRVIVCMDHNRTKNQNVVCALSDYVDNGLLPIVKNHLDEDMVKSSRLLMTKKLLSISYKQGLNYFLDNIFYSATSNDIQIKEMVQKLVRIDDNGMFTQIMLRELLYQSNILISAYASTSNALKSILSRLPLTLISLILHFPENVPWTIWRVQA